ncbi:MAG TPA: GAF domain-containing protein [Blastocatellia bacterium]|nr:GAF domain-containing protein [Blastocatellia bacterium]
MAQRPEEILKLFSRSEELLEMFRKGKAFTEELMYENERLRYRIVQLEAERLDAQKDDGRKVDELREENQRLAEKLEFLSRRFEEVEAENKDFAQRYIEVEEQNESLANLYVASYRLHSTLDTEEVIECIKEILMNLIGTEEFGLFVIDEENGELVLAGHEGEMAQRLAGGRVALGDGLEGLVAQSGEPFFTEDSGEMGEVCACIPLKINKRVIGVIAIYRLLNHKRGFTALDHRLLHLLAGHAATALVSSKLYSLADRKLKTMEGFMNLLRLR